MFKGVARVLEVALNAVGGRDDAVLHMWSDVRELEY